MCVLILMQMIKLVMLLEMQVFVTLTGTLLGDLIFDGTDGLVHSPKFMAMFTASILSKCTVHKGLIIPKAVWLQTTIVRYLPYLIAALNCSEHYILRGL